jgi:hypothetical protein
MNRWCSTPSSWRTPKSRVRIWFNDMFHMSSIAITGKTVRKRHRRVEFTVRLVDRCSSTFRQLPVRLQVNSKRMWPLQRRGRAPFHQVRKRHYVAALVGMTNFWKLDVQVRFEQSRLSAFKSTEFQFQDSIAAAIRFLMFTMPPA